MSFSGTVGTVNCSSKESNETASASPDEFLNNLIQHIRENLSSVCLENGQNVDEYWLECVGEKNISEAKRLYEFTLESDHDALRRIQIARNGDIELSTDLFFEQIRWRARWRPNDITLDQIPNALTCKFFFSQSLDISRKVKIFLSISTINKFIHIHILHSYTISV